MLGPQDFPAFFVALHECEPFPWQARLADTVATGGWPGQIAVHTACGKTSTIDIAVFELARQAANDNARTAPLRIFSIIDRRIVVDSTYQHARAMSQKLQAAKSGILLAVADALRSVSGEDTPLVVTRLRGGTWLDDSWIRSPVQPAVIASTVDQVGSRLLFRGYGVGRGQRSLHAALVGNDSLFLVDEAHLSRAFVTTVRSARTLSTNQGTLVSRPPTTVEMTATPRNKEAGHFDLDASDLKHPVLQRRLTNSKVARLARVGDTKDKREEQRRGTFVTAAVREALVLARLTKARKKENPIGPPANVVGVVVNRVATARAIFSCLSADDRCDCLLLTGRVRPHERDQLLADWMPRICAGREDTIDRPLFVVATQCVEVGADLDFDALVTEVAPLDALRQRFGRLDRLGRRVESSAVILARSDTVSPRADDPVYGPALAQTWKWLQETAGRDKQIDFGATAFPTPPAEELERLLAPTPEAPRLRTQDLDSLACTSVDLAIEPCLPLYLHGRPDSADVGVVWRKDLPEPLNSANLTDAASVIALVPPTASEGASLPVYAARAWLRDLDHDVSDVEGERAASEQHRESKYAIRWHGEESELVTAADIQGGDVIVVPSDYGGCDQYGWNPESKQPVVDIADECAWCTRWKPVFRLSREEVPADHLDEDNPQAISQSTLDTVLPILDGCPEPLRDRRNRALPVPYPTNAGWLIESRKRIAPPAEAVAQLNTASSLLGREVELCDHSLGVAQQLAHLVGYASIPEECVRALNLAALLHDAGKVDQRFQTWLHRGDEISAALCVFAKSAMNPRNRHLYEAARRASRLPAGWRHELLSVHLTEQVCADDLVLHLIAAHHGAGRPFIPLVLDNEPPGVASLEHVDWTLTLSSEERTPDRVAALHARIADRFSQLQRRYGWWGLSFLECFLILADWRQSALEQMEEHELKATTT